MNIMLSNVLVAAGLKSQLVKGLKGVKAHLTSESEEPPTRSSLLGDRGAARRAARGTGSQPWRGLNKAGRGLVGGASAEDGTRAENNGNADRPPGHDVARPVHTQCHAGETGGQRDQDRGERGNEPAAPKASSASVAALAFGSGGWPAASTPGHQRPFDSESPQFDAVAALDSHSPVPFTGEMIYPWTFRNRPDCARGARPRPTAPVPAPAARGTGPSSHSDGPFGVALPSRDCLPPVVVYTLTEAPYARTAPPVTEYP